MDKRTLRKAKAIREREGIILHQDSTEKNYHWVVKQDSGSLCDVFLTRKFTGFVWSCSAVKDGFGCVFYTGDRKFPFCSHTLACYDWLSDKRVFRKKNEIFKYKNNKE